MTATGEASTPVLLDILADIAPRKRANNTCDIREMRLARPDLAEQYDKAMGADKFSDLSIAAWITDHGFGLGRMTVARHRRGECVVCRVGSNG